MPNSPNVRVIDATYEVRTFADCSAFKSGRAVARVTIDGETRDFPAELVSDYDGKQTWVTHSGMAIVYPTGSKVHNRGLWIEVTDSETVAYAHAGKSSSYAMQRPDVVGFFNVCANAASPKYRR